MEIILYWKSIKNEVDAETWKAGKCYITEDKAEERAEAQTGNDVLDKNYCYRKIEQGIMQLQDIAHKFFTGFKRNNAAAEYEYTKVTDWSTLKAGDIVKVELGSATSASSTSEEFTVSSKEQKGSGENQYWEVTFTTNDSAASNDQSLWLKTLKSSSGSSSTTTGTSSDNKLNNVVNNWVITLRFGDRQNVNTSLLANEFHKYVILNVLQEWSKIANPTLTNEYMQRQAAEELRIKNMMYRKEEPDWDE